MASLRASAACIGISGSFSVLRDYYGYVSLPGPLSVRTQLLLLQGEFVDVNLIRVGIEQFTSGDESEIDAAVQFTRDTYATVNLGIGRVLRFFITNNDANGRDNIADNGEAETLTDEWTVDNAALDVFFVRTYAGSTIGLSAVEGPCDNDAKGMDGSVVAMEGSDTTTGFVLAHEVGHYLGLSHVNNANRLMNPTVPNGGALTSSEGANLRDHCFVRAGC